MPDDQIQVPFAGGPNETLDDRSVPPGTVISLLNASYDAQGEYQVRKGYTALDTSLTAAARLMSSGNGELLATDGASLYSYDGAAAKFHVVDRVSQISALHRPLSNEGVSPSWWAFAVGAGYRVVAWIDPNGLYASTYNIATGALVSQATIELASPPPLAVDVGLVGTTFVLVYQFSGQLVAFTMAVSNPGVWSDGGVVSESHFSDTTGPFACEFFSDHWVLGYQSGASGSGQKVRLRSLSAAMSVLEDLDSSSTGLTGPFTAMSLGGASGGDLWVAAVSSGGAATLAVDASTLAAVAGPFTPTLAPNLAAASTVANATAVSVSVLASGNALFVLDISPGAANLAAASTGAAAAVSWQQFSTSGAVANSVGGAASMGLACRPLAVANTAVAFLRSVYVPVSNQTTGEVTASYYLVDFDTTAPTANSVPFWLGTYTPQIVNIQATTSAPPRLLSSGAGDYETALTIARAGAGRQGFELFELSTSAAWAWGFAQTGRESYIGQGRYDGRTVVENGLPAPITNITDTSGSNAATYQYCCTWGWIDAQGNLEESTPSPLVQISSSTGAPSANVLTAALHVTAHQRAPITAQGPFVIIYRTPNLANGDTTLYRVNKEPLTTLAWFNETSQATLFETDTTSDADLTDGTHPALYTVSGELNHAQPDGLTSRCVYNDRIWAIGADQRTIWFTQTYADGRVPAWALLQQFTVDDAGEPLIAIASLYDRMLVFTESKVMVVYGDGGSLNDTGSSLTPPQRVAAAFGCIEPRSVVNTPLGVMYQSTRGIELLDAGLNASFIGLPVSVTTATYPVCTAAAYTPDTSLVRFAMQNSAGTAGRLIVFDLRRQLWTIHSLYSGSGYDAPVNAAVWHPSYGFVVGQGNGVARENTGADAAPWQDWGASYPALTVTSAWIKSGDLQGWQKVRRIRALGKYYDQNALTLTLDYDYQVVGETHAFAGNVIAATSSGGREQVRIIPAAGRSEAIRVTLTMQAPSSPSSSGQGAGLTGLAFEIHRARGGYRPIPTSNRS